MANFVVVRPKDDASAQQASSWCDQLVSELTSNGHTIVEDGDDTTPADVPHIVSALGRGADLVAYFGHGDEQSWQTAGAATIDNSNVHAAAGKAVVSVACKTACNLGPDAITAGVLSWLGFTIRVPVLAPHKTVDPFGDAIIDGLSCLAKRGTMQQARDGVASKCDGLVVDFDTGSLSGHPARWVGYYGALALRDHVAVHGSTSLIPLP